MSGNGDESGDAGDNDIRDIPIIAAPNVSSDSEATKEKAAIESDAYEQDGRKQDHRRQQGIKNIVFYASAGLVWFGLFLLIATVSVWAWHLVVPPCLRWLSKEELDHIQSLLFSGALSAAITLLGKKIL